MKLTLESLLASRKFMAAALDAVVSLTVYFAAKYLTPSAAEDVLKVIAVLQPVVLMFIYATAKEDAAQKSAPLPPPPPQPMNVFPQSAGSIGVGGIPLDDDEDSDLYEPVQPTEQPAVGFYAKTNNLPY